MDIKWILISSMIYLASQDPARPACTRQTCASPLLVCNDSLIFIDDVTDNRERRTPEYVKRQCMGRPTCDVTSHCGYDRSLEFSYHCYNVSSIHPTSRRCGVTWIDTEWIYGYLQNPHYPAPTALNSSCRWRFKPRPDTGVILTKHEMAASDAIEGCGAGLMVSGTDCSTGQRTMDKLCVGDANVTSLTVCGAVDIVYFPHQARHRARFFLAFHVKSLSEISASKNEAKHTCSKYSIMNSPVSTSTATATNSTSDVAESNSEILIIMLSIISGIAAVLLVILVIVCVRCRLLQASVAADYVSSDPNPSIQRHQTFFSSLEPEKPRPKLADSYSEVIDAIPYSQRGGTPTSPPYAEVESFISPQKPPLYSGQNLIKGHDVLSGEDHYKEIADPRPKRGVLNRFKIKHDRDKIQRENLNSGPDIIPGGINPRPGDHLLSASTSLTHPEDDGYSAYEPIGEYSSTKQPPTLNISSPPLPDNHPSSVEMFRRKSEEGSKPSQQKIDIIDIGKHSLKKTQLVKQGTSQGLNVQDGFKTLPMKSSRNNFQTEEKKNNNYKHSPYRDVHKSKGIVKNGIQLFEKHSC
ncbi:uncharacterized protein LOC131934871 [Physella acuta]|uniref:uncharacterized protein LOC131934871 n=1 Tax=Physella acuta TaxID=109671 RepID=UPI0027DCB641|nr:uncharacterized protein LOC131934871 [Physella acuta]